MWCFQLSSANIPNSSELQRQCQQALQLLRESLQDASAMISKSIVSENSVPDSSPSPDVAAGKAMETMLERYSHQLSEQVYELFKQKLDSSMGAI